MAQASSDSGPQTALELGAYLFNLLGPDGLRGGPFSDEFIDWLKKEQNRRAEFAGLRGDDRRFIDEINDAILDKEVLSIIVVDFSLEHSKFMRRFLIEQSVHHTGPDFIEYEDTTRVVFLTETNVGRGARGRRADRVIVHESIGWKTYTERIWPALAPCLIH